MVRCIFFLCVLLVHELAVRDIFRSKIYTVAFAIYSRWANIFLFYCAHGGVRPPSVTRPKALNGRGLLGYALQVWRAGDV